MGTESSYDCYECGGCAGEHVPSGFQSRLDSIRDLRENGFVNEAEYNSILARIVAQYFTTPA